MYKAIAIGIIAATAAGCSDARGEQGPMIGRDYQVAGFDRIEVAGPYKVTVNTGAAPSVRAAGEERGLDRMVVEVENGTLKIHSKKRNGFFIGWSRDLPVQLSVTVPQLAGAEIAGSGGISVDRIAGDSFEAGVAGSGDLQLQQIDVKRLKFGIAGSGKIRTGSGRATVADYEIAGSGDIEAPQLVAETASVSIAGSGNVAAHATGTASVDIAGSGNVRMAGGAKCRVSKAGSGNVQCS